MNTGETRNRKQTIWPMRIVAVVLLLIMASGAAYSAEPKTAPDTTPANRPATAEKKAPELPASCQTSRALTRRLLEELAHTLTAQAQSSATQYVTKPDPGVSQEKAWSDFAAGAALSGDVTLAPWAGLTAAEQDWLESPSRTPASICPI